ncbi:conserved hypothetical protein [Raphidiopsis brookii D9]|nr:conserved hypothetical protein [Raphidiopsis brookii D9]
MRLWNIDNTTIELNEPRLLAAVRQELGSQVEKLLLPPIPQENNTSTPYSPFDENNKIGIPVAPFPGWMVCPQCHLLGSLSSGLFQLKENGRRPDQIKYVHPNCNQSKTTPDVFPVRFLVSCERGHLDDFPWHYFVHRTNSQCSGKLRFEEYGISGSPSDIFVICDTCDQRRPLSDAFGEKAKQNMPRCRGRHPHLRTFDDVCDQQMKTILLGASNSWFSITLSALSIPQSYDKLLSQIISQNWHILNKATDLISLKSNLELLRAIGSFPELLQELSKYSTEKVWEIISAMKNQIQSQTLDVPDSHKATDLKTPEWQVIRQCDPGLNTSDFHLRKVELPIDYRDYFAQIILAERLREVCALIGFTRIQSPGEFLDFGEIPQECKVKLSRNQPKWVIATECKGEGIFIEFNEAKLNQWEKSQPLQDYQNEIVEAHQQWCKVRSLDPTKVKFSDVRYILLHSFAHALMRQMSVECGYNAASLKERIYSKRPEEEEGPMAGILIYTASPDSEGTLGGLVSLGVPEKLSYHIRQALQQMELCTSDPLCAEHTPFQGMTSLHWAACHACLFSPETSCERGNKYLDRGVLVPTVNQSNLAFFSPNGIK